jgi:MFS family permease
MSIEAFREPVLEQRQKRGLSFLASRRLRVQKRTGFWVVAASMAVLTAFSTAPSPLYGIYEHQENLSSITITIVYAVYAVGIVTSLLLVGHVSDWYGRRPVLIPGLAVGLSAAIIFCFSTSLPALVVGRILTGLALGATVATATAYLADLDLDESGRPTRRSEVVATVANIGGLAVGPLIAGLLAQYWGADLRLPYFIFAALLGAATVGVLVAPEGRVLPRPRPKYHPQRLGAPPGARSQFTAALVGALVCFSVFGVFAGLSAAFLAGPLHRPSPALAGLSVCIAFGVGSVTQVLAIAWSVHRLLATGIPFLIAGLGAVVIAPWVDPPSLLLFLVGAALVGVGSGALFRGTLTLVVSTAPSDDRAGAVATLFAVGYAGISVPVVGAGIALQFVSFKVTILGFGIAIVAGILLATPVLLSRQVGVAHDEGNLTVGDS